MAAGKKLRRARYIDISPFPMFVGVCVDEGQFRRELRALGIATAIQPRYVSIGAIGTCHLLENKANGGRSAVIAFDIDVLASRDMPAIAGVCSHEAVHVIEELFRAMGERTPGEEFRAYMTQTITEFCMREVCDAIANKTNQ